MGLDANIALQVKPFQVEPQSNALARVLQLQQAQQQNALISGQLQDQQATREERNALRDYLGNAANNIDTTEGQAGLYKVAPTQAAGILKGRLDLKKTQTEIDKDTAQTEGFKLANKHKAVEQNMQLLGAVNDPQAAAAWVQGGVKSGLIPFQAAGQVIQAIPQDPQGFAKWKREQQMSAVAVKEQIEMMLPRLQAVGTGGSTQIVDLNSMTRGNAPMTLAHTQTPDSIAANGLGYAKLGEEKRHNGVVEATQGATLTKPFEVTGPDGLPTLVRQDKQGNITKVDGFGPKAGSAKPLNDSQAKALLFGSRMQESDKILTAMGEKGVNTPSLIKQGAEGVPLIGGALGSLANATVASPDQQSVEQAQRDFVNAVLRRESGAAIAPSEFDSAKKQYFPSVGDSPQVKQQKAANRELAIRGLLAEVPEGQRGSITAPAKPAGHAKVSSDAEYNALPSGATFVGPDGKTRRKP